MFEHLCIRFYRLNRMGIEQKRMMRRHEATSSSEEDDSVDLLGSNYQVSLKRLNAIPIMHIYCVDQWNDFFFDRLSKVCTMIWTVSHPINRQQFHRVEMTDVMGQRIVACRPCSEFR